MKNRENREHIKIKKQSIIKYFLGVILIICVLYISYNLYSRIKNNSESEELAEYIQEENRQSDRILKLRELKKENEDIVAWLEIPNTKVNFPVLQGEDNEYYMRHTYKKEYSIDGSIFLDKNYDWNLPSSNLLIYGHNNKNGNMFEELLEYKSENYYKEHPIINFTTLDEENKYEIIAVFLSKVYYKSDKNVFRYYYFINAENEEQYNYYVEESKKASLYDTQKSAEYGEQLLTLSTCEYSQEDGRFVVVAKKISQ